MIVLWPTLFQARLSHSMAIKKADGFDEFPHIFLTINLRANVSQHSLSVKDLPIGDSTGVVAVIWKWCFLAKTEC